MTMFCPCCGQAVAGVERSTLGRIKFARTTDATVFEALYWGSAGRTLAQLADYLYQDDPASKPEHAEQFVRNVIYKVRPKLKPYGWTISNHGRGRVFKIVQLKDAPEQDRHPRQGRAARMTRFRSKVS